MADLDAIADDLAAGYKLPQIRQKYGLDDPTLLDCLARLGVQVDHHAPIPLDHPDFLQDPVVAAQLDFARPRRARLFVKLFQKAEQLAQNPALDEPFKFKTLVEAVNLLIDKKRLEEGLQNEQTRSHATIDIRESRTNEEHILHETLLARLDAVATRYRIPQASETESTSNLPQIEPGAESEETPAPGDAKNEKNAKTPETREIPPEIPPERRENDENPEIFEKTP